MKGRGWLCKRRWATSITCPVWPRVHVLLWGKHNPLVALAGGMCPNFLGLKLGASGILWVDSGVLTLLMWCNTLICIGTGFWCSFSKNRPMACKQVYLECDLFWVSEKREESAYSEQHFRLAKVLHRVLQTFRLLPTPFSPSDRAVLMSTLVP